MLERVRRFVQDAAEAVLAAAHQHVAANAPVRAMRVLDDPVVAAVLLVGAVPHAGVARPIPYSAGVMMEGECHVGWIRVATGWADTAFIKAITS